LHLCYHIPLPVLLIGVVHLIFLFIVLLLLVPRITLLCYWSALIEKLGSCPSVGTPHGSNSIALGFAGKIGIMIDVPEAYRPSQI
jgi:hypothetical protein